MERLDRPLELDLLVRRRDFLERLESSPIEKGDLISEVHHSRMTVTRALEDLESAGFVSETPEGYVATVPARLAVRRYRALVDEDLTAEDVELVEKRRDLLGTLSERRLHKPDLVDRSDNSRSTVDRAISNLEEVGWVERGPDGFATTDAGRSVLDRYRSYLDDQRSILTARDVLAPLGHDCDLPTELVTEALVESGDARYRLFELLATAIGSADRYRVVLPGFLDARHLRLCHGQVVESGLDVEFLASPAVLGRLRGEFPHLVAELADADSVSVYGGETTPYALLIARGAVQATDDLPRSVATETGGRSDSLVILVTLDDGIAGLLATRSRDAVEWASDCYERLRGGGQESTDHWRTAPAAAELPRMTGERLPARLRSEGFVRVDDEFLSRGEPLDPATAWRVGLGLAEVDAGYAVPRSLDEDSDRSIAEEVTSRLRDGADVAVLGASGSGKSTVCKRIAVQWARERDDTVLYRESGSGEPFESVGALSALLERTSEPVLVVVEDAVRSEGGAVFDLVDDFRGRDDVRFLVDANERDWNEPGGSRTARSRALAREYVDTVYVPPLDEAYCRRCLDHGAELFDGVPDLDPSELVNRVRDDASGAESGSAFALFHHLSWYGDPLGDYADDRTHSTLDDHVDRVRTRLAELGPGALRVGVLSTLLSTAGVSVAPAHLYALTSLDDVDPGTVRDALDVLEGEILFPTSHDRETYRTTHGDWAVQFLDRLQEVEGRHAQLHLGRSVTAVLELADEPDRREAVLECVGGGSTLLETIAADPQKWADDTVTALFRVGREYPRVAELFGTTEGSAIELPSACSPRLDVECTIWRGRMYATAGRYERARTEYEALDEGRPGVADSLRRRADFEGPIGLSEVERSRGNLDAAEDHARAGLAVATDCENSVWKGRALLELGRIDGERGNFDAAEQHLQDCLDAFGSDRNRRECAQALDELASIATSRGDYDRAEECYERSREVYAALGDDRGKATVHRNLGSMAFENGDFGAANDRYLRALEQARTIGDRGIECGLLRSLGGISLLTGDGERAERYTELALSIAEEIGEEGRLPTLLSQLGTIANERGDLDEAVDYHSRALERAREIGARRMEARALRDLSSVHVSRNDFDRARECADRALDIADEVGDRQVRLSCLQSLGSAEMQAGNLDASEEVLDRAVAMAKDMDHPYGKVPALRFLARTARRRGDFEAAEEYARRCRSITEQFGHEVQTGFRAETILGLVELDRGNLDAAAAHFDSVLDEFGPDDDRRVFPEVFRATVARSRGRLDDAEEWIRSATDLASVPTMAAFADLERGAIARERGDHETAREATESALAQFEGADPFETARARRELGRLDESVGRTDRARENLRWAIEAYRSVGADHHATELLDRSRLLGSDESSVVGEDR